MITIWTSAQPQTTTSNRKKIIAHNTMISVASSEHKPSPRIYRTILNSASVMPSNNGTLKMMQNIKKKRISLNPRKTVNTKWTNFSKTKENPSSDPKKSQNSSVEDNKISSFNPNWTLSMKSSYLLMPPTINPTTTLPTLSTTRTLHITTLTKGITPMEPKITTGLMTVTDRSDLHYIFIIFTLFY